MLHFMFECGFLKKRNFRLTACFIRNDVRGRAEIPPFLKWFYFLKLVV